MKYSLSHILSIRTFGLAALAALSCPVIRSQSVVATIATSAGAYALAVNPVSNKIYVVSNTKNLVTVIDGATNATTTVAVGQGPTAIDVDTVNNKIFVANTSDSSVTEIDGATNTPSTIKLNGQPVSVAVNSQTHKVYLGTDTYLTSSSFGVLEVVDEASGSVTDVNKGMVATSAIAISTASDTIYVGNLANVNNPDSPVLTIVNGADNSFVDEGPSTSATAIAVDPTLNLVTIEAGGFTAPGTYVYDVAKGISYTVSGDSDAHQVALDQATHTVYSCTGLILNYVSHLTAELSGGPASGGTGVVFDGTRNKVYYSAFPINGAGPSGLFVLDLNSDATSTVTFGPGAVALALNPTTGLLYVLNNDATVTVLDVTGNTAPLSLLFEPESQTVAVGTPVAFNAVPQNSASVTYQWALNGVPLSDGAGLSGSSSGTLYISRGAAASDAGSYTCTITNSSGSVTTQPATLTVSASAAGRLVNLSSRASIDFVLGSEPIPVTAGFGVSGSGKIDLILRGVGPSLIPLGVSTIVIDPTLSLYDGAASPNLITSDTGWQNPPSAPKGTWAGAAAPVDATNTDFQEVGAFTLTQGFEDDAIKIALPAGTYTEVLNSPAPQTPSQQQSTVLAEIYDADGPGTGTSLTNLSTQAYTSGASIPMTVGFVISGSASMTVLLRVSGPALAPFGITNFNAAPVLSLYDSNQNTIDSNVSWQGNNQVAAAAAQSGAFAWTNPSSHDDAILITLPPGSYTASVLGTTSGMSLVEVYAVSATP